MSADSGFSSRLSTVNKFYDPSEADRDMFPEQEECDEDTYDWEEDSLPFTRKLPRYFKTARRARSNAPVSERDSRVKKLSLTKTLIEDDVSEGILPF